MARSKSTMFTDTMIRKLKPEEKKYLRSEGNGFSIRVMPSGVKTWLYVFAFGEKRREMNLGSYPEVTLEKARDKFEEARKKVRNGIDPMAEMEAEAEELRIAPSVAMLADEYIEKWAKPNKKSWKEDKRMLDVEVVPKWGKRKAKDVRRREVVLLLEGIAKRGPVMANRTRALLSKLFNFALEREIVETNPVTGVKPLVKEKPSERNLSEDEIRKVWQALSTPGVWHISPENARCLKLILLTGQRPGEVITMHSGEIAGQWWTIPHPKNGIAHRVFLTATALDLIGNKTGYIFESPRTNTLTQKPKPMHVNAVAHAVRLNLEEPGEPSEAEVPAEGIEEVDGLRRKLIMSSWSPHDLRRTMATKLSELGFWDEVIDVIQNHKKRGIVRTYNRNRYDREKQEALEAWERKLLAITSGKREGRVLSLLSAKHKH
jgi:integrase